MTRDHTTDEGPRRSDAKQPGDGDAPEHRSRPEIHDDAVQVHTEDHRSDAVRDGPGGATGLPADGGAGADPVPAKELAHAAQSADSSDGPLRFALHDLELEAGTPEAYLHPDDAAALGVRAGDRIWIRPADHDTGRTALVKLARKLAKKGRVMCSAELMEHLAIDSGSQAEIAPARRPHSVDAIKRKLDGHELSEPEIQDIIKDISGHALSPIEITAWAVATYVHDMSLDEVVSCVHAMVANGERVEFDRGPVMDVHSIGGVPGNKYAPLCVPIVAANGLLIPKTSSRAISSACGTADFMEVLCNVEVTTRRIKEIGESVGGTLAWGGGVNLAPADDVIIRAEYPLSIDPRGQLLSSVMAKKMAVGAKNLVIDIPVGRYNKMKTEDEAHGLARDFIDVGRRLGIQVRVAITNGSQPIGHAIGPTLEAREALQTLEGDGPLSLQEKACTLAGTLLEMGGACKRGDGVEQARRTLRSGKALQKLRQIIDAQGGDPDVRSEDLEPGKYTHEATSPVTGIVEEIDNHALTAIARAAGSPRDKGAGLYIHRKRGRRVEEGSPLYTIYADHRSRLHDAVNLANRLKPIHVEGMVVDEVVG